MIQSRHLKLAPSKYTGVSSAEAEQENANILGASAAGINDLNLNNILKTIQTNRENESKIKDFTGSANISLPEQKWFIVCDTAASLGAHDKLDSPTVEQRLTNDLENYKKDLLVSLELEPVETGIFHDAENILNEVLDKLTDKALIWIQATFLQVLEKPSIAAGFLQCLARQNYDKIHLIARSLVTVGIESHNVELREAAIGAIEQWGDKALIPIIRRHEEKVSWLSNYARSVIKDLSED